MSASANNARAAYHPKSVNNIKQLASYAAWDWKELSVDSGSVILARNWITAGAKSESNDWYGVYRFEDSTKQNEGKTQA